jgi:hypothetical protein
MKTQNHFSLSIQAIVLGTVGLLLIPFIAMQFTSEVNWGPADFLIMGALLFGLGLSIKWLIDKSDNLVYRIAVAMALGTTFLLIWANLGVGLVGAGPNVPNVLYLSVVVIGLSGMFISRLKSAGMERTMYGVTLVILAITGTTLLMGFQNHANSSIQEILLVNGIFAGLYLLAALLFRSVARKQTEN